MKLYDANQGEIITDGIELKQIGTADVRKNFAYVSQEAILFNGTLKRTSYISIHIQMIEDY